jgi:hypothetical protein
VWTDIIRGLMKRDRIKILYLVMAILVINSGCYSGAEKTSDRDILENPGEARIELVENNIIENGGFEQKGEKDFPVGWQPFPANARRGKAFMDSKTVYSGKYSLRFKPTKRNTRGGFGVYTRLDPFLIKGKEITISGYAKIENIRINTAVIFLKTDRTSLLVIPKGTEDKFVGFSKSIKIADSIPEATLFIFVAGKKGGVWIDNLSLEITPGATAITITPDRDESAAKINSPGWQDSVFISPNGRQLYFAYMPYAQRDYDDILLGRISEKDVKKRGPIRPGTHGTMYLETYKAVRNRDGTWGKPINLNINGTYSIYAAKTSFDGTELYYASPDLPGNFGESDIYFSKKMPDGSWGPHVNMGPNINTRYNEDHPCLSADGKTLYFARNKRGATYGWEIMVAKRVSGGWKQVERLPSPINQSNPKKTANHQPFITVDNKELYFTRIQQIYKSVRQPNGKWAKPVRIFKRIGGHASVTADGRYLYFVSVKDRESQERHNYTIWYSEKQKDGNWGAPKPVD